MMTRSASLTAVALGAAAMVGQASAGNVTVYDFSGLDHATVVTDQIAGIKISADNPNPGVEDAAIIWDYQARPDLADGGHFGPNWTTGNRPLDTVLGNGVTLLGNTSFTLENRRPAGMLIFEFDEAVDSLMFTVVDIEGPTEFQTNSGFFLDFFSEDTELGRVFFGDLLTPGNQFYDPTIQFANGSINQIGPFLASDFDAESFDRVELSLGGSSTLAQITTETFVANAVPTPGAVAGGLGLMTLIAARRRRQSLAD